MIQYSSPSLQNDFSVMAFFVMMMMIMIVNSSGGNEDTFFKKKVILFAKHRCINMCHNSLTVVFCSIAS
jgi:hypothetical protein